MTTEQPTMHWEDATTATIDPHAYYIVQHNGHEWRDFDLGVISGRLVQLRLAPDYVRGRPEWVAKIVRPLPHLEERASTDEQRGPVGVSSPK